MLKGNIYYLILSHHRLKILANKSSLNLNSFIIIKIIHSFFCKLSQNYFSLHCIVAHNRFIINKVKVVQTGWIYWLIIKKKILSNFFSLDFFQHCLSFFQSNLNNLVLLHRYHISPVFHTLHQRRWYHRLSIYYSSDKAKVHLK